MPPTTRPMTYHKHTVRALDTPIFTAPIPTIAAEPIQQTLSPRSPGPAMYSSLSAVPSRTRPPILSPGHSPSPNLHSPRPDCRAHHSWHGGRESQQPCPPHISGAVYLLATLATCGAFPDPRQKLRAGFPNFGTVGARSCHPGDILAKWLAARHSRVVGFVPAERKGAGTGL